MLCLCCVRWNFSGPGPLTGAPVPIKRGVPGAVMSVGGCMDQTIHADTPHIFTHVQVAAMLPYRNVFTIICLVYYSSPTSFRFVPYCIIAQLPAHYVDLFMPAIAPLPSPRPEDVGRECTGPSGQQYVTCGCCDLRYEVQ